MLCYIRSMGKNLAYIEPLEGGVDPGFGVGDADRPDQGLPGGGFPHPGNRPPGSGAHPGNPAFPDNSLPSSPPPTVAPGQTLVLVRDPVGVWHYATIDASTPPPKPVPVPPPTHPDQGLPPHPAQPLPTPPTAPTPTPHKPM